MTTTKVKCPHCSGERVSIVHYVNGTTGINRNPHCTTCGDTKAIDAEHAERIEIGEKYRDARIDANLTLRELASMAGVSPSELSDFENGRLGIAAFNAVETSIALAARGLVKAVRKWEHI